MRDAGKGTPANRKSHIAESAIHKVILGGHYEEYF